MRQESSKKTGNNPDVLKIFFSGGVAGCVAKSTVAPLERVKILFQVKNPHYDSTEGVFRTLVKVFEKEGVPGLFKGNWSAVVRVFPYAAIQFTTYEDYKRRISRLIPTFTLNTTTESTIDTDKATTHQRPRSRPLVNLIAGSCAGATAVIFTYPLDLIRARIASQVTTKHYNGIIDATVKITQQEGLTSLYKGIKPTLVGILPYAGLNFLSYEFVKSLFIQHWLDATEYPTNVPGYVNLISGGTAGAVAQTLTYPLDLVRRRMQLQGFSINDPMMNGLQSSAATNTTTATPTTTTTSKKSPSIWRTIRAIYQNEGLRGLFKGVSINYIRAIPMAGTSWFVFENVKRLVGVSSS